MIDMDGSGSSAELTCSPLHVRVHVSVSVSVTVTVTATVTATVTVPFVGALAVWNMVVLAWLVLGRRRGESELQIGFRVIAIVHHVLRIELLLDQFAALCGFFLIIVNVGLFLLPVYTAAQ